MVHHFKYHDRTCMLKSLLGVRPRSQEVAKPYSLWRKKWPNSQRYSSSLFNQSSAVCSLRRQKYERKVRFLARSQNYETRLLASSYLPVCLSVSPSVRQQGANSVPMDGFLRTLKAALFSKFCRENSRLIELWQEQKVRYLKTYVHL
jgi:hypothetical protein